ncbi:MAG: hypothetical protein PVF82_05380 [Gammaproteobacteria bacterium]|jgi:cytochrome c556
MSSRSIAFIAIGLWVLTVLAGVYLFVVGQTRPAQDGRTAIILESGERAMILGEMRDLLAAVQGVVAGLARKESSEVAAAARRAGSAAAADVAPGLMTKLPFEFKQLGMSVHQDFDKLAAAIDNGEDNQQVLFRMNELLQRCVACHATYQLSTGNGQ